MSEPYVIRPCETLPTSAEDTSLVFLLGPIKGGGAWQEVAISPLHEIWPTLWIASPRRPRAYAPGEKFTTLDFARQADWEYVHLRLAAKRGLILGWLPPEDPAQHSCTRAYAQTSRVELGEWTTRHQFDPSIKMVIGIHKGFTGGRYLRHHLPGECPRIPLCASLEETCKTACDLLSP